MFSDDETTSKLSFLSSSCGRLLEYFANWHRYVSISSDDTLRHSCTQEFSLLYKRVRDFCGHELFDEKIKRCQAECEAMDKGICTLCLKKPSVENGLCERCNDEVKKSTEEVLRKIELEEFKEMDPGNQKH